VIFLSVQLYATATPSSLASVKSRMVLPFWYWLTQVVLQKRPLNGSSSSSSSGRLSALRKRDEHPAYTTASYTLLPMPTIVDEWVE